LNLLLTPSQDHYRRVHSLILNYPKLPGVILREGDKLEIVPMETCTIEPDQLFKKVLPDEATRDMVSTATLRPQQKLDAITRAVRVRSFLTSNPNLTNFRPGTTAPPMACSMRRWK
jgi:hypothetical protein